MQRVDAVVVGAGVVGLAIARALALDGREVIVTERHARFGMETSSRNSEVIHAGLYYPEGSLKAAFCVQGRHLLYEYCRAHGIAHRRTGKLIFASRPEQASRLDEIEATARAAGVDDLVRVDAAEASRLEPALSCAAALFSPSTGIVDSHGLMATLLGEAEARGATLVCNTVVSRVTRHGSLWSLHVDGEAEPAVSTPILINAAGLGTQRLAQAIEGLPSQMVPPLHLARGVYFACTRKLPFRHLLYPVPVPGGLGTHLTLDLGGGARFGPDVEWIETVDYSVDPGRRSAFFQAARLIWPELREEELVPAYAGIRPKLAGPDGGTADFLISTPADHGLTGLVNLFGIESPGLTASLAIANHVVESIR